jgi:hypothetical protein
VLKGGGGGRKVCSSVALYVVLGNVSVDTYILKYVFAAN